MGLKDEITKVVDNVKDAASEALHRSTAQAEQTKRDVAGDTMSPSEKLTSVVNQATNTAQANVDALKQEARDKS